MIAVIGSLSTDFVVETDILADRGETVTGRDFHTLFGGKGANQAVAAARLGGQVTMFGCVGDDVFGAEILANLKKEKIDSQAVEIVPNQSSGSAHITVYQADNAIIYIPGANQEVSVPYLKRHQEALLAEDFFVIQNEIPIESIQYLIDLAQAHGKQVIYDPAPAIVLDESYVEKCSYLTPNEFELNNLCPNASIEEAIQRYPERLLVTLGKDGVTYAEQTDRAIQHVPAYSVEAVDTTGAGDTFTGAFAYALSKDLPLKEAVAFANGASALSVQKLGAQTGMPTWEEVKSSPYFQEDWMSYFAES